MKTIYYLLWTVLFMPLTAWAQQRYLGGDISMLPSYEKAGTVYRDSTGKKVKPLKFLKKEGWNAIRVRLFVDPKNAPVQHQGEGVCQDLDYVIRLSKQVKKAGFDLMLDFHYSDTWADPAKQFIPKRWADAAPATLPDSVYQYTRRCLQRMVAEGCTPDMIQVGNEITNGMMWPVGRVDPSKEDNFDVLSRLISSGARACREVCPKARLIVHTEKAGVWSVTKNYYEQMKRYQVDYDIIGLSYYPMWHDRLPVLRNTLDSLAILFPEKEVMIVETAAYYSHENDKWAKGPDQYSEFYPITKEGQRQFTQELMAELRRHKHVTGVFWWFPEENESGRQITNYWVNRGLFDNRTGRALPAFYEFK